MGCGNSNAAAAPSSNAGRVQPIIRQSSKITVAPARGGGDNGGINKAADGSPAPAASTTAATNGDRSPRGGGMNGHDGTKDAKPLITTGMRRSSRSRSPSADKQANISSSTTTTTTAATMIAAPTMTSASGSPLTGGGKHSPDSSLRRRRWVDNNESTDTAVVAPRPSSPIVAAKKRPNSAGGNDSKRLSPKPSNVAATAADGWESAAAPHTDVLPNTVPDGDSDEAAATPAPMNIAANQPLPSVPLVPPTDEDGDPLPPPSTTTVTPAIPTSRARRRRGGSINIATFDLDPRFCGRRYYRRRKEHRGCHPNGGHGGVGRFDESIIEDQEWKRPDQRTRPQTDVNFIPPPITQLPFSGSSSTSINGSIGLVSSMPLRRPNTPPTQSNNANDHDGQGESKNPTTLQVSPPAPLPLNQPTISSAGGPSSPKYLAPPPLPITADMQNGDPANNISRVASGLYGDTPRDENVDDQLKAAVAQAFVEENEKKANKEKLEHATKAKQKADTALTLALSSGDSRAIARAEHQRDRAEMEYLQVSAQQLPTFSASNSFDASFDALPGTMTRMNKQSSDGHDMELIPTGFELERTGKSAAKIARDQEWGRKGVDNVPAMVLGVQGFREGKHYWEVELYNHMNNTVQIGVIRLPNRKEDIWDQEIHEAGGWCLLPDPGRLLPPAGSSQPPIDIGVPNGAGHAVGAYDSGDSVGVLLDLTGEFGTLTFFRNGRYYSGIAFDNIPKDLPLYPAFSSRNEASFTIIPYAECPRDEEKLAAEKKEQDDMLGELRAEYKAKADETQRLNAMYTGHSIILNTSISHDRTNQVGDALIMRESVSPGEWYKLEPSDTTAIIEDEQYYQQYLASNPRPLAGGASLIERKFYCVREGTTTLNFSYRCAYNKAANPDRDHIITIHIVAQLEHPDLRTVEPKRRNRLRSLPDLQLGAEAQATLLATQQAVVAAANDKAAASASTLSSSPMAQPRSLSIVSNSTLPSSDTTTTPSSTTANGGTVHQLRLRPRAGSLPAVAKSPHGAVHTPNGHMNSLHHNPPVPVSPDSLTTPSPLSSSPGGIETSFVTESNHITTPSSSNNHVTTGTTLTNADGEPLSARSTAGLQLISDTMSVIAEESSREATPQSSHRSPARSAGHSSYGSFGSSMSGSSPMGASGGSTHGPGGWVSNGGTGSTNGTGGARLHGRSPSGGGSFHSTNSFSLSPGGLPPVRLSSPDRSSDLNRLSATRNHRGSVDSNPGSSSSGGSGIHMTPPLPLLPTGLHQPGVPLTPTTPKTQQLMAALVAGASSSVATTSTTTVAASASSSSHSNGGNLTPPSLHQHNGLPPPSMLT